MPSRHGKQPKHSKYLPESYPYPSPVTTPPHIAATSCPLPDDLAVEVPGVFDGQIKSMDGEEFHSELVDEAKPFCIHTPRAIPFAHLEKLREELTLLQSRVSLPLSPPQPSGAHLLLSHQRGTVIES